MAVAWPRPLAQHAVHSTRPVSLRALEMHQTRIGQWMRGAASASGPPPLSSAAWEEDPRWKEHVEALSGFPGQLKLLELCGGASTAFLALRALLGQDKVSLVGLWDIDPDVRPVLLKVHGQSPGTHLGADTGNILPRPVEDFPFAHVLVAGPPCPPWSSLGQRSSFRDPRADVFSKVVAIAIYQARHGHLGLFALENVAGLLHKRPDSADNPAGDLLRILRKDLPDWTVDITVWNTKSFGLPQRRPRVYIVGRRADLMGGRPPSQQQPFAHCTPLARILDLQDNAPRTYTAIQRNNIGDFKALYRADMEDAAKRGSFAVVDVSRTPSDRTVFAKTKPHPDLVECLTASGPQMHVFALGEGLGHLSVDRPLRAAERGRLQGFPPEVCEVALSDATARRIFGNAMSVPVVGTVLAKELALMLSSCGQAVEAWVSVRHVGQTVATSAALPSTTQQEDNAHPHAASPATPKAPDPDEAAIFLDFPCLHVVIDSDCARIRPRVLYTARLAFFYGTAPHCTPQSFSLCARSVANPVCRSLARRMTADNLILGHFFRRPSASHCLQVPCLCSRTAVAPRSLAPRALHRHGSGLGSRTVVLGQTISQWPLTQAFAVLA